MEQNNTYMRDFVPYGLGALLIGLIGGFSTLLGPAFVSELGLSYQNTTWTALAQAISSGACAPILGRAGDQAGRKATLLGGILVFTFGNVLSALSRSLVAMLVARFVVGLGTAAMTPVILGYIVARFPAHRRGAGFSLYMLISSSAVILGPILGELLIRFLGWRGMVWCCCGICGVIFFLSLFTGEGVQPSQNTPEPFDLWGALWVLAFFGPVLCLPALGQNYGWTSPGFLGVLVWSCLSLWGLLRSQARAPVPILPGPLLKRPCFFLSILVLFFTQGLMQTNMTSTIIFVSYTQPHASALSGWAIAVMYLGMSLGAIVLGPLADRWDARWVLTPALLLTALGCGLMGLFSVHTPAWALMISLGLLGLGLGGNGTILMKSALWGLPPQAAGASTGAYGLGRDLSAPFGVAVLLPLFTNGIDSRTLQGIPGPRAALLSLRVLVLGELIAILLGLITVWCLPRLQPPASRERGPGEIH